MIRAVKELDAWQYSMNTMKINLFLWNKLFKFFYKIYDEKQEYSIEKIESNIFYIERETLYNNLN